MKENLRVIHYSNGDPIPTDMENLDWANLETGGFGVYPYGDIGLDSEEDVVNAYGNLYNWYAVVDSRGVCPDGWRIPEINEMNDLDLYVSGMYSNAGNILKSCRQVGSPVSGACNTSEHPRWDSHATHYGTDDLGFAGLPAGFRQANGFYFQCGQVGFWWSSSELSGSGRYKELLFDSGNFTSRTTDKKFGLSVRCIKE